MALRLSVVTPERPVVDAEVDSVVAPGAEGEFGLLPAHEAYLAPLREGLLSYQTGGETHRLEVSGGFAEVSADQVTILVSSAAPAAD